MATATAEQIKALLESHATGDDARFLAVAMQVAAQAARQGHGKLADELRQLIEEAKERAHVVPRPTPPTPLAQPRGELSGLLSVAYPKARLGEMVLPPAVRRRLERVLKEHRQQSKLRAHGLAPRHRLLLVGPPGSGKTMTASALAGEMGVPLFTIVLESLITKFMGETAAKLRVIFETMRATRGVYLFDEFDAIGGHRAAGNDVGEIRRVLNSFLQLLEQDESGSVIIAATNHPQMLDHALFRRFDDVLEFSPPVAGQAEQAMKAKLGVFASRGVDWKAAAKAAQGLSYGEITRACEDAVKEAILNDTTTISTETLVHALTERRTQRKQQQQRR